MSTSRKVEHRGGIWTDLNEGRSELDLGNALVTEKAVRDITTDIVRQLASTSIQIIPGEVTEVIYNEEEVEKRPKLGYQDIGCIHVDTFDGFELPSEWVYPLDPNVKNYPVIGELVHIICIGSQAYYTAPLNVKRSVNNNSVIGITKSSGMAPVRKKDTITKAGKNFKPISGRPTRIIPGDIVFDGREGQSIKLGKNVSKIVDGEPTESMPVIKLRLTNDDPNIKKRFQPKAEEILDDAASLYLIKDEEITLTPARIIYNDETVTPSSHKGKQVFIDSDKLIFNTKSGEGNNIGIYSGHQLNIVSKGDAKIIGKNVYIGDARKKGDTGENGEVGFAEHAVLGDALCELLYYMSLALESAGLSLQNSQGIGNFGLPAIHPAENAAGATVASLFSSSGRFNLQNLKDTLLSKNVYISRNGPRE